MRIAALADGFYIWHGLCGESATTVFEEMALYAKAYPTEVLILDLVPHHFNNFQAHHHTQFAQLLVDIFGDSLCDSSKLNPWSTVGQFWSSKTNVIILYAPPAPDPAHGPVWWAPMALDSFWPQHCKTSDAWLKWAATHVRDRDAHKPLWVLQGVITPDAGIITKINGVGSIADLARLLNPRAVHFLTETANLDHNIVMLDFYDNCSLIDAIHWCNIGGQPIFSDNRGFGAPGPGHYCHLRVLPILRTVLTKKAVRTTIVINGDLGFQEVPDVDSETGLPTPREGITPESEAFWAPLSESHSPSNPNHSEHVLIAVAINSQKQWHSATMSRGRTLPWSQSAGTVPLSHAGSAPTSPLTMRLFTMCDNTAYAVAITFKGAEIFRYNFSLESWYPFAAVREFGPGSGFEVPSPIYRSTFSATSPLKYGEPAFLSALTVLGLTVSSMESENTRPQFWTWAPPVAMLETYFTMYAPLHVRQYFLAYHNLTSTPSTSAAPSGSAANPAQVLSSISAHASRQSVTYNVHTQVKPFHLKGQFYMFVQAPVSVLFRRPPAIYEGEAINFLVTFDHGRFTLLELEGMPPPSFHGSYASHALSEESNERLFGSAWHVESNNSCAYFICRTSVGIRSWKFDGARISELPLYRAFTDEFHWHEPPYCFGLRSFVLEDRVFFMGRSSAGLCVITLQDDVWIPWPGFAEFTDFGGWATEDATKSIHVTVAGDVAYVTGRCSFGLVTVSFDGADWTHFGRPLLLE